MMNIQRERDLLIERVQQVNDLSLLRSAIELLDQSQKHGKESEEIIGYSVQGQPLTQKDLIERAKQANEDIKSGRVTEHENLKKEMDQW